MVIKSLAMSKITHLLLALSCPSKQFSQSIDNIVADFLWNNKTPSFRMEIIKAEITEGRMRLHNLHRISQTFKITWLRRIFSSYGIWIQILKLNGIEHFVYRGDMYAKDLKDTVENPFWKFPGVSIVYHSTFQT